MCGIAGIIGEWPGVDLEGFRDESLRAMQHRGPNGAGAMCVHAGRLVPVHDGPIPSGASALLLHRRLSILDLTEAGAQPMADPEGRHALVFNGEIYNFEALRAKLGLEESALRSKSDTEVLLYWLKSGGDLGQLVGMFAFAFLDLPHGSLQLARDAYGIKPLFVTLRDGALAFASDIRVLLTLPGVSRRLDRTEVLEVFRWGAPFPGRQSILSDLLTVQPGESLRVDLLAPHRPEWAKWCSPSPAETYEEPFAQAVRDVREAFLESVSLHLKSDVRVGTALSGGIDSSSIVMAMRHLQGDSVEIHTVSHIASAPGKSEEKWIDVVNAACRATPHKVRPTAEELAADLDDMILYQGEPFYGTSIYAQYRVFRMAQQAGLTVMLDGQGADEILAGYEHYVEPYLAGLLRAGRWRRYASLVRLPEVRSKARFLAQGLILLPWRPPRAIRGCYRRGWGGLPEWMLLGRTTPEYDHRRERSRLAAGRGLKGSLVDSVETGLVNLLRYEDRNSMRFSIESRVPFLSKRFTNLILSMPADYIYGPAGQSKYVFREAMRGIVPDVILNRRDKIGFENDEAEWLWAARHWAEAILRAAEGRSAFISAGKLGRSWRAFLGGARSPRFTKALWGSLIYLRWLQLFEARD
jgi:asparagine synthase (glutamine-hydrolysing)